MSTVTYHMLDLRLDVTAPQSVLRDFDLVYGRFRKPCGCELCGGGGLPLNRPGRAKPGRQATD